MTRGLSFLHEARLPDYGSRLSRLRWQRRVCPDLVAEWNPDAPAREALAGADDWIVVRDPSALPAPAGGPVPAPPSGRVLLASAAEPADPPFVHTLRELEGARLAACAAESVPVPAALAFRTADFPAEGEETARELYQRLLQLTASHVADAGFLAISFGDPSERERPELTRRLGPGNLRILDSGCGAGGGIALAKARNPGWRVTGIEKDPRLASRARRVCDRVLEGDLSQILPELERAEDAFDAVVFADVLEHLEDPVAALAAARRVAAPGAKLLVSVPNVGHLSLLRDLVAGRFDPTPSGLTDARHLRWFSRAFLAEAIAEAGWRVASIEGEAGAPPPSPEPWLALAAGWPEGDPESLMTYQWIGIGAA